MKKLRRTFSFCIGAVGFALVGWVACRPADAQVVDSVDQFSAFYDYQVPGTQPGSFCDPNQSLILYQTPYPVIHGNGPVEMGFVSSLIDPNSNPLKRQEGPYTNFADSLQFGWFILAGTYWPWNNNAGESNELGFGSPTSTVPVYWYPPNAKKKYIFDGGYNQTGYDFGYHYGFYEVTFVFAVFDLTQHKRFDEAEATLDFSVSEAEAMGFSPNTIALAAGSERRTLPLAGYLIRMP